MLIQPAFRLKKRSLYERPSKTVETLSEAIEWITAKSNFHFLHNSSSAFHQSLLKVFSTRPEEAAIVVLRRPSGKASPWRAAHLSFILAFGVNLFFQVKSNL